MILHDCVFHFEMYLYDLFDIVISGVTTAPATPAMQGGGTLGGRHITKLTVF